MKIYLINLIFALSIVSCSQTDELYNENAANVLTFQITSNQANVSQDSETIYSLSAYLFREGVLRKQYDNINPDDNMRFSLPILSEANLKIYFLANATINASHIPVEGSTLESNFLAMTSSVLKSAHKEEEIPFFSAGYSLNRDLTSLSISLVRATARIDIDASSSELLVVDSIVAGTFPAQSYLIKNGGKFPEGISMTKRLKFETPVSGIQNDVMRVYEGTSLATTDVYVRYDGIPSVIHLNLPTIQRNHIYTIKLYKQGASLGSSVNVAQWEEGDSVNGSEEKIMLIDTVNSHFPEGIQVDYENNAIHVVPQGGDFLLSLLGSGDKDIMIEGGKHISYTKEDINKWNFHIKPLEYKETKYQIPIKITSPTEADKYIWIYVDGPLPLPTEPPTVNMGGVEWMSFNSYSTYLEDQIFPTLNSTVEEHYNNKWLDATGMHFQWGRIQASIPWQTAVRSYVPHKWSKWDVEGSVPCPPGYRIPSLAEFQIIFPVETTLPGTYTISNSNETINATIEEVDPFGYIINGYSGRSRYLKLTSSSGAVLIFPLAGYRPTNELAKDPGLGMKFGYWTNKGTVGNMKGTRLEYDLGNNDSAKIVYGIRYMDAFGSVRCIKG